MDQNQIIGSNIRHFRERMSLSQAQLALYLGVTREEVSYFETGKRTIPTKHLSNVASLFCVDEYDLYEKDPEMHAINVALAFRADTVSPEDLPLIANFQKIVLNYINMKKKLSNE
jgi:transcriptional regulator with XRE-family HTH domain